MVRSSIARALSVVACAIVFTSGAALMAQPAGAAPSRLADALSLHPLTNREPIDGDTMMAVWVGLKNERRSAQLVCVFGEGFTVGLDATDPVIEDESRTHACQEDDEVAIVLPGETYYYAMDVKLPKSWNGATNVELRLGLSRKGGTMKEPNVWLEWKGTVGTLVKAGRPVFEPTPR